MTDQQNNQSGLKTSEEALTEQTRQLLDDSVEYMDGPTRARLHRARSAALEGRRRRPTWVGWAATGTVAASFAAALIYMDTQPPPLPPIYEDPVQQAAAEEMELMDDLEFVAWLVMEEGEGGIKDQSS